MDRPWEKWEETDDAEVARSRWLALTDHERAAMAAEAGMTIEVLTNHVNNILSE